MPRGPEIWILLIVLLVLFGAKRLPGAARSLGQSMRILKAETKGLHDDDATVGSTGTLPAGPATGAGGVLPVTPMPPTGEDQQAPPHP